MNLHFIVSFFLLVLAVHGAPRPKPKPSPKAAPKPDPKARGQMAIIWNNGRMQRIDLPGTGMGPYDFNGNPYYGIGRGNKRRMRRQRRRFGEYGSDYGNESGDPRLKGMPKGCRMWDWMNKKCIEWEPIA